MSARPIGSYRSNFGGFSVGSWLPAKSSKSSAWSAVNLPFADFQLPLSHISESRRLPPGIEKKLEYAKANGGHLSPPSKLPSASSRSALPDYNPLAAFGPPALSQAVLQGNGQSGFLKQRGPKKSSKLAPFKNQVSLPLSIYEGPLSLVQLPLSKFALPLSHVGNSFPGTDLGGSMTDGSSFGLPGSSALDLQSTFRNEQITLKGKTSFRNDPPPENPEESYEYEDEEPDCAPDDYTCIVTSLLKPELSNFNLSSLSLPYSFLNTPLGFFNLPLSFLNLPYGSFNLPFGHLNLPFGYFNVPLFELMQTFGDGGALAGPILHDLPVVKDVSSPLDRSHMMELEFGAETIHFHDIMQRDRRNRTKLEDALNYWKNYTDLVSNNSTENSLNETVVVEKASDAIKLANRAIGGLAGVGAPTAGSAASLAAATRLFRDTLPAVLPMDGAIGAPFSLFPSPFSLYNLPLGFLDQPLAFLNLPFSHFNLPLAYLTLPFAGTTLPLMDIKPPELDQTVETASVELADMPPSLLEVINPDNDLNTYLNLPLSEMNLPLAIMDMPFAVFDMPFAFTNLPLAHFNNPLTHVHLPFEISSLPFSGLAPPFISIDAAVPPPVVPTA